MARVMARNAGLKIEDFGSFMPKWTPESQEPATPEEIMALLSSTVKRKK